MDAAFGAVCAAIRFLEIKLSAQHTDFSFCTYSSLSPEQEVNYLCQQCEASLQFLQSLCQQKTFRERLLRNKVFKQDTLLLRLDQTLHYIYTHIYYISGAVYNTKEFLCYTRINVILSKVHLYLGIEFLVGGIMNSKKPKFLFDIKDDFAIGQCLKSFNSSVNGLMGSFEV